MADTTILLIDDDEGIHGEVATIHEGLYAAMQEYAASEVGTAIFYDAHSYPYYFTDTDGDGEGDEDEINYGNQYSTWTPTLLRAAYNYQFAMKDPGVFAHNGTYVLQILYDTLAAIGGDVDGMTRPE
jgi:hypothetical protein